MWRDRDRYPEHNLVPDTFWLLVAALLFAACGLVWLIGQVAAILFGAHQHLPVRLVDMLGVLLRLPGTWDDPARPGRLLLSRCCPARSACTRLPSSPSGCPPGLRAVSAAGLPTRPPQATGAGCEVGELVAAAGCWS